MSANLHEHLTSVQLVQSLKGTRLFFFVRPATLSQSISMMSWFSLFQTISFVFLSVGPQNDDDSHVFYSGENTWNKIWSRIGHSSLCYVQSFRIHYLTFWLVKHTFSCHLFCIIRSREFTKEHRPSFAHWSFVALYQTKALPEKLLSLCPHVRNEHSQVPAEHHQPQMVRYASITKENTSIWYIVSMMENDTHRSTLI